MAIALLASGGLLALNQLSAPKAFTMNVSRMFSGGPMDNAVLILMVALAALAVGMSVMLRARRPAR